MSILAPYTIDCKNCCGLCCVALYFSKTDGFPENKDAGKACKNLLCDYKCKIHSSLSKCRLKGCMAYDCFGAGQQVTKLLPHKPDWNTIAPQGAEHIFQAYVTIMQLHQTLWYLAEASILAPAQPVKEQLCLLLNEGKVLAGQPLKILSSFDVNPFREKANKLLKKVCTMTAAAVPCKNRAGSSPDYMGKNMKGQNLSGKDFSMSFLIAADLRNANLFGTNFLGADMRDTNIENTDLSQSLFLTQIQINGAKGNHATVLPVYLQRPASWEH